MMSRVAFPSPQRVACKPALAGFRRAAVAVALAFAWQSGAHAQSVPTGAIHGGATFQRDGNNLLVTTTNGAGGRSVINWQSFGVPAGSRTWFQQPDASSTSINRVTGGVRSDIFGILGSNAHLVLVNPSGIAIGPNAMIDTAGFTASALDLSASDAIRGRQLFRGGSGDIRVGEGAHILARQGDVVLVGSRVQVERQAVVQARGATILAAGEKVELTGRGLEGIQLEVRAGSEALNLGTLQGDAVGIFASTLRHSGLVQAQAVTAEGGKVVLKSGAGDALVDGRVIAGAQGGKGGSIDVLGERVALLAGAAVDASGARGGGAVRIGGDYQGGNPEVVNASAVYVDAAARIQADAVQHGDGGRVIVWSEGTTRMHGQVSARGGTTGGNGGFAEVSGRHHLQFTGAVDLRAPRGTAGTLLLDPNDIVIDDRSQTDTTAQGAVFEGGTGVSHVNARDLEGQLGRSSVIVTTRSRAAPPAPEPTSAGNITVAADIAWSSGNALDLQADGAISLQGNISAHDPNAALSLQALGGGITQDGATRIAVGKVQASARGTIDLASVDVGTGVLTLRSSSGDIAVQQVAARGASGSAPSAGGTVTLEAKNGSVSVQDVFAGGGANTRTDGGGAGGVVAAAGAVGGKVFVTAARDITLGELDASGGDSTTGAGGQGGEVHLNTGGIVSGSISPDVLLPTTGFFLVTAAGGTGGTDVKTGNGLRGGKGGLVQIAHARGDLLAGNGYLVNVGGGDGGSSAVTAASQRGGLGGDGGDVKFTAAGRVLLATPFVAALGGEGGLDGDDSTPAASGALGTFRAQGTSVAVTDNLVLGANWINDSSLVQVQGASQAVVLGSFRNAGTVTVDGVLHVADAQAPVDAIPGSAPPAGAVFANQASGVLAGKGTLVVGNGLGTVRNFGTIAPGGGGAVGTLTLNASLVMEPGSTYAADLLDAATHDRLVVTGSVATGGILAVNLLPGASVAAGDSFRVVQSGALDLTTLSTVNDARLRAQASANDLLLVALGAVPSSPPPASAPAVPPVGALQEGRQQADNQVASFAAQFDKLQEAQVQRIGKDDIVITDTACTR